MDATVSEHIRAGRLKNNFEAFLGFVEQAEAHLENGRREEAAMSASIAAWYAAKKHPGVFASSRLENLLNTIGRSIPVSLPARTFPTDAKDIKRVLHVTTELPPVGGLTRLVNRWIDTDANRQNSLLLTRYREALPASLTEAVHASGGKIYRLNQTPGSMLDWAKRLRKIAQDYDMLVLNIHAEDVIPLIAFSGASTLPPVAFLNHADHLYWLGSSICRSVLNLREAASDISINRRGVPANRSLLLPTLVEAPVRKTSKAEARASLGIEEDEVLMISVARAPKYRTIDDRTYADRFIDILSANPKAKMFVVGSGMPDGWETARQSTNGAITGLQQTSDPSLYFEAADIYIDSYPFSSSTSLMEAAGYGLPLVTLFLAPDEARLVGINHLGLIGGLHQARSESDWEQEITRLVQDKEYRAQRAKQAEEAVRIAQPNEWKNWLERAYQDTLDLPPVPVEGVSLNQGPDELHLGEPDIRHEDMYGSVTDVDDYIQDFTGMLPLGARLRAVSASQKQGTIQNPVQAAKLVLVPEWIKARVRR